MPKKSSSSTSAKTHAQPAAKNPALTKAKETKSKGLKTLVDRYRTHTQDTGSPEVQVAIITQRIQKLAAHLRTNNKDHDSKRGLLMLVGKRRRLLNYIHRHDQEKYQTLITDLGLRK